MVYLTTAVILVGVIGMLNLVFTFGVVKRLREHTAELTELREHGGDQIMLRAGATAGQFRAVATDGTAVARDELSGRTLVSFFSPGCVPCQERMPAFLAYAAAMPGGRDQVIAVVAAEPDDAAASVAALSAVARVVVEPDHGPLGTAFAVQGFPAICVVDADGVIIASGTTLDELPSPALV
ncbi:hypothetical protein Cme02nite_48410 [Catellatospora methionotrophica]|uniref:Thioredoxin domain-containing protein n=1 Tax=Catellatospora methionotrophica TaxID=121620 RepID=A0A8J3LJ24_9ACTN|nr:TlpA disulfide reductase family protein [Catellatospora methionotrophica]GIG16509.1 hypothetical protein Cme02nite_48410 [Catellatospora methionotrophica]